MGEPNSCFYKIASIIADGGIPLCKYKSRKTGMTVCIAQAEGPLVASYLCVATEAHDDDGLPHTLEHLIFLGSEKYPFKGVLDLISNRCLASGTNAWTDTDHTCYTMTTAGHEGTLQLLPIYLDHLLFPTLTDDAYITEVHHVTDEGDDAGVVYCEMQGRENSADSRCYRAFLHGMYPESSGYRYETGGILQNLRESTSNEKVRQYHKKFYRPENLCLILVGMINENDVFRALEPVESRLMQDFDREEFVRPWQTPVPMLTDSVSSPVSYPCDDEDYGNVVIGFRGPHIKDYSEFVALKVLLNFLTFSSVSPIQKEFVEAEKPIASEVDHYLVENLVTCFNFHFHNVPVNKMDSVKDRFSELIANIADGKYPIDMKRMQTLIRKKKLSILCQMENRPQSVMADALIGEFLYGKALEDLKQRLQNIPILEELLGKNVEYWMSLLKTYCVDGKYVLVVGTPSKKLAEEMRKEEEMRVKKQQDDLEPSGLAVKGEILRKAMKQNKVSAPPEVISSIPMPSIEHLNFHSVKRGCNVTSKPEEFPDFDFSEMPCRFHVDDVKTNFVQIFALFDTADVPKEYRSYLPLFIELLTESPICKDDVTIPYEEVVEQLTRDTISHSVSIGLSYERFFSSEYSQVICLSMMVEPEKYEKAVQWINDLFRFSVFEVSRIKSTATKMMTNVATLKTEGDNVANMMITSNCFTFESNRKAVGMMHQHRFLTQIISGLDVNSNSVIKELNDLRSQVTRLDKVTIHIGTNLAQMKKITSLEAPWKNLFTTSVTPVVPPAINQVRLKQCHELLFKFEPEINKDEAVGLSSVDSSYLYVAAPCVTSYNDPDYPALLVLLQYLIQCEGPMWQELRGKGLSYSYGLFCRPNEGLIYYYLFKSVNMAKAYHEGQKIIQSHLKGKTEWQQSLLESAIGSLSYVLIEKEKSVGSVVCSSLKAYYRDVDWTFTSSLLTKIQKITFEDLQKVGEKYLTPLFDIKTSKASLCCSAAKVVDVCQELDQHSRQFEIMALEAFHVC